MAASTGQLRRRADKKAELRCIDLAIMPEQEYTHMTYCDKKQEKVKLAQDSLGSNSSISDIPNTATQYGKGAQRWQRGGNEGATRAQRGRNEAR